MVLRRMLWLAAVAAVAAVAVTASTAFGSSPPTGERTVGKSSIEPAYDDRSGSLIFLSTPAGVPFPTHTNRHAVSPLYLVEYPPGTSFGVPFNCEGVPGNCPDHDGLVAAVATGGDPLGLGDPGEPSVYGVNPALVPGHDHLVDGPGGSEFNVAWEVVEILFTPKAVTNHAITHLTTDGQIDAALASGYIREVDLGFAFHCAVVSRAVYDHGT